MQESEPPEDAGRQLFGELFGFKEGDRVKEWRKSYPRWRDHGRGYWKYGTVKKVIKDAWEGYRYRVKWDREWGACTRPARKLTRVRPYVRTKIRAKKERRWRW